MCRTLKLCCVCIKHSENIQLKIFIIQNLKIDPVFILETSTFH